MISAGTRELQILADVREMDWMDRGLCAETDPEAFFVEKGGSTRPAKRICARCPVRVECLNFALDHDEQFGVYGGLSARERRNIKRASRRAAA